MFGKNTKVHVWRKDNEASTCACLGDHGVPGPRVQACVMFRECISYISVETFVEAEDNINSARYVGILEQNVWPVVAKDFSVKSWTFQDDNCPLHRGPKHTRG